MLSKRKESSHLLRIWVVNVPLDQLLLAPDMLTLILPDLKMPCVSFGLEPAYRISHIQLYISMDHFPWRGDLVSSLLSEFTPVMRQAPAPNLLANYLQDSIGNITQKEDHCLVV